MNKRKKNQKIKKKKKKTKQRNKKEKDAAKKETRSRAEIFEMISKINNK
jgi:hypothetical protein